MRTTVDPVRFVGLPLITKALSRDEFRVDIDGLPAGRIVRQTWAYGRESWRWTITGPAELQAGLGSSGETEDFKSAQQAFRVSFDRWLEWAQTHKSQVPWTL